MQQMPPPMHPMQPTYSPHPSPPAPKKKPNKALLAVGIGCGSLALIAGIVAIVGVLWLKGKVTGAIGTVEEIAAQEERLKALDKKYPFTAPAQGKPLKLDEKRVQEYLAIRAALVPVFKNFEKQAKTLDDKEQGIRTGLQAVGMTGELIRDVRTKFAEQLEAKRMSSTEFHSITGTIYASYMGKGMARLREGQREVIEQAIQELDKQLASKALSGEQKKMLQTQRDTFAKQLAGLPPKGAAPSADMAIYTANAALLDKYKTQIENEANPALDVFLFGDATGMEKAFQPLQGISQ